MASRDASLRPSITSGVGSAISADGTSMVNCSGGSQSRQFMQDIEDGWGLAVVFSEPPTQLHSQLLARGPLRLVCSTDQTQD